MDRRRLILTASALGAGSLPPLIPGAGLAQSSLPPARPTDQGKAPPVYDQPAYSPPSYAPPSYQSQPGAGSQDQYDRRPDAAVQGPPPPSRAEPTYSVHAETYSREELVNSVSDFLGVTAEAAGGAIERVFHDNGRPTGYIAGEEGAIAFTGGLRYGKGLLYMKNRQAETVYWQGPSIGFDIRINASRVFTLCYNLQYPDAVFRRFPGVEGSAYLIGGLGVNYQRAEDIVLAPIRAGLGLGAGVNIGYLAYSRKRHWIPL